MNALGVITMDDSSILRNIGLKITAPRLKILQILTQSSNHHLSAENIYKILLEMGDEIALATIYRVLTQFESTGLITKHNFDDTRHSVFELCNINHHDHLICTQCNYIEEFYDETIENRQEIIAKQINFKILTHSLTIYGICAHCQNNTNTN